MDGLRVSASSLHYFSLPRLWKMVFWEVAGRDILVRYVLSAHKAPRHDERDGFQIDQPMKF